MSDEKKVDVYEIDINKKYILQFSFRIPEPSMEKIRSDVKEWIEKENSPFLFINGGDVKLVKVEE